MDAKNNRVKEVDPGEDIAKTDSEIALDADSVAEPASELEDLGAVRLERRLAPATADDMEELFRIVDERNPDLGESVAKSWRKLLLAEISSGVHRREDLEVRVPNDTNVVKIPTSLLSEDERARGLENTVKAFEDRVVGEGDFVEEDEVACVHRLNERTVVPFKERGCPSHALCEVPKTRLRLDRSLLLERLPTNSKRQLQPRKEMQQESYAQSKDNVFEIV